MHVEGYIKAVEVISTYKTLRLLWGNFEVKPLEELTFPYKTQLSFCPN